MLAQLRQNTINVLLSLERLLIQRPPELRWVAEFFSGRGQLPARFVN